jgi:hypothetical protein
MVIAATGKDEVVNIREQRYRAHISRDIRSHIWVYVRTAVDCIRPGVRPGVRTYIWGRRRYAILDWTSKIGPLIEDPNTLCRHPVLRRGHRGHGPQFGAEGDAVSEDHRRIEGIRPNAGWRPVLWDFAVAAVAVLSHQDLDVLAERSGLIEHCCLSNLRPETWATAEHARASQKQEKAGKPIRRTLT